MALNKHLAFLITRNPIEQFKHWREVCLTYQSGKISVDTMCLSTASRDGKPSSRYVLCTGFDEHGFTFFTSYSNLNQKTKELDENPFAALCFLWSSSNIQMVRIEGRVEKFTPAESDIHFGQLPRNRRAAYIVGRQGEIIETRDRLLNDMDTVLKSDQKISLQRPDKCGGYRVVPDTFQFYQSSPDCINERIRFRRAQSGEVPDGKLIHLGENGWVYEQLNA